MAFAQLGSLKWRVDPNNVQWSYQVDANRIETLGGQVVQILGATLSDLTVMGDLGQDHRRAKESWQLANAFHKTIKSMMDAQTLPAKTVAGEARAGVGGTLGISTKTKRLNDIGPVHKPLPFTFTDGIHNWSFNVLIKSIADGDGSGAITYSNGKFNHTYILTLFIVQSGSDKITKVASDAFLARISEGIGWKQTLYNGPWSVASAQAFIQANGGSVNGLLQAAVSGQPLVQPAQPKHAPAPVRPVKFE